jgi:hypothetical protein
MNSQLFIVGCVTAFAFLAHLFIGTKESMSISPAKLAHAPEQTASATLQKNWLQTMCAFQMISVDLLVLSILIFVMALTDIIPSEQPIILALSAFYLLWGFAWLLQLALLKAKAEIYLKLGQWIMWLLCSGLLYWGA